MISQIRIYTQKKIELDKFLSSYDKLIYKLSNYHKQNTTYYWTYDYDNPLDLANILAALLDNISKFPNLIIWICLDPGVFINISTNNYNQFIKYLFERYPY